MRGLTSRETRLLWLLGGASFFSMYDEGLFSLLLVQLQNDLAIPEASLGTLGSLVKLGALPAFGLMMVADRLGRRRVLLWTIAGYTLLTGATALAPDYRSFVAFQCAARLFMAAELMLALIVVIEEFRPTNRGLGIGLVSLMAVLGRGAAMIAFGFVDDLPGGWRALYALGVPPLLLLAYFRRRLPETQRFRSALEELPAEGFAPDAMRLLASLVRAYPGRFAAVMSVGFLWSLSNSPVDFFLPKYAQEVHGWTPGEFARVAVLGGALGITALPLGGWISDRLGRRPTLIAFFLLEPVLAISLYSVGAGLLFAIYATWVFASVGADVVGRTAGPELFPTSYRATAAGAGAIVGTLGGVLALSVEGALFNSFGTHWTPVCLIAAAGLAMPILVLVAYPETSGRVLEEVSPERVERASP